MAATAVTSMTRVVPTQAERMPAEVARRDGKFMKKSVSRRPTPDAAMSRNRVARVNTPIINASRPTTPKNASQRLARAMMTRMDCKSLLGISVDLPELLAYHHPKDVEGQGHKQQGQARCEDGLIAD